MNQESNEFVFKIQDMDCAEEVTILKRELSPLVGGEDHLFFDILNRRMTVTFNAEPVTREAIIAAVGQTGMRAEPWDADKKAGSTSFWKRHGRTLLTSVSGAMMGSAFLTHIFLAGSFAAALGAEETVGGAMPFAVRLQYLTSMLTGIWFVLPKAWFALKRLRPDMNLLMCVAVLGALFIDEWFEAAAVAFLFSFSQLLEAWSVGRARRAVATLMDLSTPIARVRDADGNEITVAAESVSVGTVFLIRPGEKIPLDGAVIKGTSDVNQAPITGESVPVSKQADDEIYAGTINGDGLLEAKCSKPAEDTILAQIIRMVGEAQSRRSPSELWVEKFARIYTPIVMVLALLVLLCLPLLLQVSWHNAMYRALVLLVIACPCALVISTPVSIVAALAAAARNGVLIKGGEFIETPSRLRALALDKTGTLTQGKPVVTKIVPLNGHTEAELLERAAALEAHSNHPLALAILDAATERQVAFQPAEDYQIIQGKGATAKLNGREFWLGSHRYLEERKEETTEVHQQLEELSRNGQTVVVIGNDTHVCGFIALADRVRETSADVIRDLHAAGIEQLVMLTGDNQGTAQTVAREVGMDQVHAELLPEDKLRVIESLVAEYEHVAMVGDGVNDAPAMSRSSLGIAMGAAGSDVAIESADIALMTDDLTKIPWLIHHSRHTLNIIRQNIIFALSIKVLFVILMALNHASLWAAIAADMGASLLVIFNGLRLLQVPSANESRPAA
ncbi:heavy metal translocating P-type ATPase [Gimesia panareensis]|uniref:heavy metal translocating P-type ATPase n=1 Tax=Gimesia panareensis TaxID=2527978 RepID=UPI00118C4864|nr:heavy metal translocating P-type ATPase [Gimesia panareensis]QDU48087.1 putative cadmium-transporting ATPase [Gimesia panareensis]